MFVFGKYDILHRQLLGVLANEVKVLRTLIYRDGRILRAEYADRK